MTESEIPYPWQETLSFEANQLALNSSFWKETLRKKSRKAPVPKPLTEEWYLEMEKLRYRNQGWWIPHVLEFEKHAGEKVLCIGDNLGTDWVQYAINQAEVWVSTPLTSDQELVRKNFLIRNLDFKHRHFDEKGLPYSNNEFDVAVLHIDNFDDMTGNKIHEEVFRVLKPGGKLLAVAPARFQVHYFLNCLFPKKDFSIKNSGKCSGLELRQAFQKFIDTKIHKRHLAKIDLPPLLRWIPTPLVERSIGKFLIFKGRKPLSMALPAQQAA